MNILEKDMIVVLRQLKEEHGVFQIKAEFEAEGSRMEEMMRLKDITSSVGLPIILKIGGVEAITDIYNALSIGVDGIIAPMAETPFAVGKYLNAIEKYVADDNRSDIEFAVNIETITAFEKLDQIFELPKLNYLKGITVGRVDLTGSMGYGRDMIDDEILLEICRKIFRKAKERSLKKGLGGGISLNSIDFIKKLRAESLVDKFETRKIVFKADSIMGNIEKGILKAVEFELLWLQSKRRYYSRIKVEDESRIAMLEKRLMSHNIVDNMRTRVNITKKRAMQKISVVR